MGDILVSRRWSFLSLSQNAYHIAGGLWLCLSCGMTILNDEPQSKSHPEYYMCVMFWLLDIPCFSYGLLHNNVKLTGLKQQQFIISHNSLSVLRPAEPSLCSTWHWPVLLKPPQPPGSSSGSGTFKKVSLTGLAGGAAYEIALPPAASLASLS